MWPYYLAAGAVALFFLFQKKTPSFVGLHNDVQFVDPESVEGGVIQKTIPQYHSTGGKEVQLSNGHTLGEFDGTLNVHTGPTLSEAVRAGTTASAYAVVMRVDDLAAIARGDAPIDVKAFAVEEPDVAYFAGAGSEYAVVGVVGIE